MTTIPAATLPDAAAPASPPTTLGPSAAVERPKKNLTEPAVKAGQTAESAAPAENRKVSLDELTQAVEQLDSVAKLANRSVQFKISDSGDDVQVLVIDKDTEEVIREIPPDAVLELADRIQGTLGLLIDKVV